MAKLTQTQEDYLRAIMRLEEDNHGAVGITKIANYLHLSKSTVSERTKELMQNDLVVSSAYSPIRLTKSGKRLATEITR